MAIRHESLTQTAHGGALTWTPFGSVRTGVIAGFAIIVGLLIVVVAAAAIGVTRYQDDT